MKWVKVLFHNFPNTPPQLPPQGFKGMSLQYKYILQLFSCKTELYSYSNATKTHQL